MKPEQSPPPAAASWFARFGSEPLYLLLPAVPLAVLLELLHVGGLWLFIVSCLAIVPLAGLMGRATENLAESLGPGIGGLLNATFGNAAELIIALAALWKGEVAIVKASITGSIIGNILLVLGAAIFAGGLRYTRQTFNRTAASLGATLLALASIGLIFPTIHFHMLSATPRPEDEKTLVHLSEEIAGILAVVYLLSLWFSLKTHQHLFAGPECGPEEPHEPEWSRRTSLIVLLAATALVALMSELLVDSVKPAAEALGMNRTFIGVIVVAVIGNAAEHSTAILVAVKNQMDLAVNIAVGSSIQIALFVAPVLVFAGLLLGQPIDLHFSPLEVVAVVISIGVVALVAQDGECHWMEGVLLLAVYLIIGLAFYHLPESAPP
ncbi:MAG: calcium/proton exchanger [Gemmataceae bacterium]|nr:calcium/proton exchanger [Gemmataceae bacterium]